jgi:hypothetical protein
MNIESTATPAHFSSVDRNEKLHSTLKYTGCLKIASTKKKLWHLEVLRNPKNQFLIFLNKRDKVTLSQHILRLRRGSIF